MELSDAVAVHLQDALLPAPRSLDVSSPSIGLAAASPSSALSPSSHSDTAVATAVSNGTAASDIAAVSVPAAPATPRPAPLLLHARLSSADTSSDGGDVMPTPTFEMPMPLAMPTPRIPTSALLRRASSHNHSRRNLRVQIDEFADAGKREFENRSASLSYSFVTEVVGIISDLFNLCVGKGTGAWSGVEPVSSASLARRARAIAVDASVGQVRSSDETDCVDSEAQALLR
jgi:hypothetical protein